MCRGFIPRAMHAPCKKISWRKPPPPLGTWSINLEPFDFPFSFSCTILVSSSRGYNNCSRRIRYHHVQSWRLPSIWCVLANQWQTWEWSWWVKSFIIPQNAVNKMQWILLSIHCRANCPLRWGGYLNMSCMGTDVWLESFDHHPITKPEKIQICNLF